MSNGNNSFSELFNIRSSVSSLSSNGEGETEKVKGTREGGKVRAWRLAFEALDKVEAEGGDLNDLRSAMIDLRDDKVSTVNGKPGIVKRLHMVGISTRGNKLYLTGSISDAKDSFPTVYLFSTKKAALASIDTGDMSEGKQV